MGKVFTSIRIALSHYCPCFPPPPYEEEGIELPTICQAPAAQEPMHVPQKEDSKTDIDDKFSITSGDNFHPTLSGPDHFDSLWKATPHATGNATPPLSSNRPTPRATRRYRQTVALFEELYATYVLIKEVFEYLPHSNQHWFEVMSFYYRVRSFINEGSDKYFYYEDRSNTATDANFGDAKIIVNNLIEEWEKLEMLLEERMIGQMALEGGWEETVPHSLV